MRNKRLLFIILALLICSLILTLAGCGDAMYQKDAPDVYPGYDECMAKDGDYNYDGYDGSWECDVPNGVGIE